MISYLLITLVT